MNRPLPLQLLPRRFAISLTARYYRSRHASWAPLYRNARLCYAPSVKMDLVPGDVISDNIAFTGVYELPVTRRFAKLAKQGGLFVDVGSNLGYFALLWASYGPDNRCIAVEASPRNVAILRRNIEENQFEQRITLVPHAVGEMKGRLQFDPGPGDQTGWGGLTNTKGKSNLEVDVERLDEIIRSDEPITLLKVDIEGADAWALKGCHRLLKSRLVREVWFEQNKSRARALGISETAAQEYLQSVGYAVSPLNDPSSDLVEWVATPK